MNCRPGDLAYITGVHACLSEANGQIVQITNDLPVYVDGEPSWKLSKRVNVVLTSNGQYRNRKFFIGESVWFDELKDRYLRPIRDPGEDAQDETLSWLPVPSRDEVAA